MGLTSNLILVLIAVTIWKVYDLNRNPPLPTLDPNPWWGPDPPSKDDTSIKPFKINIPQADVDDLNARLALPLRVVPPLENANFTYGFNSEVLKVIVKYWRTQYNWKTREERLNRFPQFKTQIEGLNIHFIHIKPKIDPNKKVTILPLLMVHGWPGSIVEFDEILPLLTSPHEGSSVVFEVICPSLPGYGFSQSASKQGLGTLETAQIFLKLMKRLNFNKFYVQGGDWGSLVVSTMATMFPENIIAMHSNMPATFSPGSSLKHFLGAILPSGFVIDADKESFLYPISSLCSRLIQETGYLHIQASKPDTIGSALENSPVGLAAYILEKFSTWTNADNPTKPDGGLLSKDYPISLDRLLDNISLYWFSKSITTSVRYYAESFVRGFTSKLDSITTEVPSGFSGFKHELALHPKSMLSYKYKAISFYRFHDFGGHFAAMEVPKVLAKDLHDFVTENENQIMIRARGDL